RENLKRQEDSHRKSAQELLEYADAIETQHRKIGARREEGGRPPLIGFTALVALLAKAYEQRVGQPPSVSVPIPFRRLVSECVDAVTRADANSRTRTGFALPVSPS